MAQVRASMPRAADANPGNRSCMLLTSFDAARRDVQLKARQHLAGLHWNERCSHNEKHSMVSKLPGNGHPLGESQQSRTATHLAMQRGRLQLHCAPELALRPSCRRCHSACPLRSDAGRQAAQSAECY